MSELVKEAAQNLLNSRRVGQEYVNHMFAAYFIVASTILRKNNITMSFPESKYTTSARFVTNGKFLKRIYKDRHYKNFKGTEDYELLRYVNMFLLYDVTPKRAMDWVENFENLLGYKIGKDIVQEIYGKIKKKRRFNEDEVENLMQSVIDRMPTIKLDNLF